MNLQPRGTLSRRGFVERSLMALTAAGLPMWAARETLAAQQAASRSKPRPFGTRVSRMDNLRLGAIATGSRGIPVMMDALKQPGVECVAICDVDQRHIDKGLEALRKKNITDVQTYRDFRELLDRDDIDIVTIVTPDHWHALIAIEAMKRGKDVYCEKPLTLTVAEGQAMVKVARRQGTVFQTGSQQRSDARFRLACELVRNGRIGKVKRVEARIGQNPVGGPFPELPIPKELDWNFWLGPTPEVPYREKNCHYEFRWWQAYSGGKMTDWGAHHNDIAQWGLGRDGDGPVSVEGQATPFSTAPDCYNWHPDFTVTCTYDDGIQLVTMAKGENGVKFEGEDGWIFVNRSKIEASDPKLIDEPLPRNAVRLEVSTDHMGDFINCVRTRKRPICDVEIGHRSVTVCHIENIALLLGRQLQWDPKAERFVNDDEANTMLSREMRSPWKLEV